MLRQIRSLLAFAARPGQHRAADAAADAEHRWVQDDLLPAGLELTWLGTSGFRIAYEGHAILIDPYITRVPVSDLLRRHARPPSRPLLDCWLPDRVDAVLIGHTHFDHALDAPLIARRDGAKVYGSRSMVNLMQLYGEAELAIELEPYRVYEVGPFAITFVPSVHSKLVLGRAVPFDGDITCEHVGALAPSAYGCGQVWGIHIAVGGVTFYHQGSADLIDHAVRHHGVDIFLAGIAGRGFTDRYIDRIGRLLDPKLIVPHHYDDFFRPLDQPMGMSLNVDLAGFMDEVRHVSSDLSVRSLAPMTPIIGGA